MWKQTSKPRRTRAIGMGCALLCGGLAGMQQAHAESYLMSRLALLPEFSSAGKGDSVSVYGTVDESINYVKAGSAAGKLQMQSGGEYTSKIGVYGQEDLGGGLKAEFNLEAGFQADTGAVQDTTSLFNRASWIGLKSRDWGALRMGNQIAASLPLFIDTFGVVSTNSAFAWAGAAVVQTSKGVGYNSDLGTGATTLQTRVPKSVSYWTPRWNGVSAQLMWAANATGAVSPKASNQGGVVSYENGPFYLATSYNQVWSSSVTVGTTTTQVRNDIYGVGGVYDTGKIVLSSSFMQYAPKLAGDGIARVYTVGSILPIARHTWRASLVLRDTSGVHDSSGKTVSDSALGLMLGYDYDLSRRTALYVRAGLIKNYGYSSIILNSQSLPLQSGSANPQLGVTSSTVSLGMYHHF